METGLQSAHHPSLPARLRERYRTRSHLTRRIRWVGFTLSSLNIVLLAFLVFDTPLGIAADELPHRLIGFAGNVTDLGTLAVILTASVTVLIAAMVIGRKMRNRRRRYRMAVLGQIAVYLGLSVVFASSFTHVLKFAIGRARPLLYDSEGILGFHPFANDFLFESFPSGHSTHIGGVFAALALLFPRYRLMFFALGIWLGATRIILGVHYPSDVAAGLAVGAWFAFATAILFARFGILFILPENGWPLPRFAGLHLK